MPFIETRANQQSWSNYRLVEDGVTGFLHPRIAPHALVFFWYLVVAIAVCAVTFLAAGLVPDGGIGWLVVKAVVSLLCSTSLVLAAFCWTKRFKRAVAFAKRVFSPASDKGSDSTDA